MITRFIVSLIFTAYGNERIINVSVVSSYAVHIYYHRDKKLQNNMATTTFIFRMLQQSDQTKITVTLANIPN